ncbi:MAG: protein kinase domain-containing protein [Gammaproteobacteria bacterium]
MRVLIIDDHVQFGEWLRQHISVEWPDAEILVHDPSAVGALPSGFSPSDCDLVLLDYRWDDRSGLDVLKQFKRRPGFPPVILLTAQGDQEMAVASIKAGADDYLPKDDLKHEEIVRAVRESLRRGRKTAARFAGDTGSEKTDGDSDYSLKGHRFVRRLAKGGVSSVYLMENEASGQSVVVKVLREVPDVAEGESAFERFLQEYELISTAHHPNIVRIYDLGVGDDHAYIAMEYFPDGDLRKRIRKGISMAEALRYLDQMARALAAIHRIGVLHRDIKPGNVMLRCDDSIALIDFGLAKHLRTTVDLTRTGEIFGTPYYMSPEQGHGDPVDERGDIYGLGIILYEMVTGEKPYIASTPMGVIYKHSHAAIPTVPGSISILQPLIDKMMAKRPEQRYQSADELLDDVTKLIGKCA